MNTTYIVGIWAGENADRWQELSRFVGRVGDSGYANACAYAEGFTEGTPHANTWHVYTTEQLKATLPEMAL